MLNQVVLSDLDCLNHSCLIQGGPDGLDFRSLMLDSGGPDGHQDHA